VATLPISFISVWLKSPLRRRLRHNSLRRQTHSMVAAVAAAAASVWHPLASPRYNIRRNFFRKSNQTIGCRVACTAAATATDKRQGIHRCATKSNGWLMPADGCRTFYRLSISAFFLGRRQVSLRIRFPDR
jgi:hypothetical protein